MNALSLDYINSKSPYLVKLADDGDYVFQTAKGVIDDFEMTAKMLTEDK